MNAPATEKSSHSRGAGSTNKALGIAQHDPAATTQAKQEVDAATAQYEASMAQQPPSTAQQYLKNVPKAPAWRFEGGPMTSAGRPVSPYASTHGAGQPMPTGAMAGQGMSMGQLAGMYSPLGAQAEERAAGDPSLMENYMPGLGESAPGLEMPEGEMNMQYATAQAKTHDAPTEEDYLPQPKQYEDGEEIPFPDSPDANFDGTAYTDDQKAGIQYANDTLGIGWQGRDDYTDLVNEDTEWLESVKQNNDYSLAAAQAESQRNFSRAMSSAGMDPATSHVQGLKLSGYWANAHRTAKQELINMEKAEKDRAYQQELQEDQDYLDSAQDQWDATMGTWLATADGRNSVVIDQFYSWMHTQYLDLVNMGAHPSYIAQAMHQLKSHWLALTPGTQDIYTKGDAQESFYSEADNIYSS